VKTIFLPSFTGDWRAVVEQVQQTGEVVALELDGTVYGFLLPAHEALPLVRHFALAKPEVPRAAPAPDVARNYLELLRDDPTLVPVVDGQPLKFVTMMNAGYIEPEQLYQFQHPRTRQIYVYHASELQQTIGRAFSRVEFIPVHPKDFVEEKS
jgi:hypothetical protein